MSYTKELEERVLKIKGEFFLSPRERLFLEFLERAGIPEEVAVEGIKKCYLELPFERRQKYPLFLCLKHVQEAHREFLRRKAQEINIDWKAIFFSKLKAVREFLSSEPEEPKSEVEAERTLREIESEVFTTLWEKLDLKEKERLLKKYRKFRKEENMFKELIKDELREIYGIPFLSLYVD